MLPTSAYLSIAGILCIDYIIFRNIFRPLYFDFNAIRRVIRNGISTTGIVVDLRQKVDLDQRNQYAPIVKFIAKNGMEHLIESNDFRHVKKPINTPVDVCYETDHPSEAVINPKSLLGFKLFLMFVIILVTMIINIGIVYSIVK